MSRSLTPTRHPEPASSSPATVYVISEEDILRYGLRDLRDILRIVPGVEWSFDQLALQGGMRGFATNFSQTLLMINGREVQNLIAAEPFISFQFQAFNIEQVEVVMGPGSTQDARRDAGDFASAIATTSYVRMR